MDGAGARGSTNWHNHTLPAIKAAVDAVSVKEFAFACDVSPSTICDAIAERERKRFAAEWIDVLLAIAPPVHREAILSALAIPNGYVPQRRKELTPEEELAQLRRTMQRLAPAILQLADEELSR